MSRRFPQRNRSAVQLGLVITLILVAAGSARSAGPTEEPGSPRSGKRLFFEKGCSRCHALWESAEQKRGPNLASVGMGRNLYQLSASIWSHWSKMKTAGEQENAQLAGLSSSEVRDIVSYLYYLNYYAEPADAAAGEAIFQNRGCTTCHATDPMLTQGRAGPPIYALKEFRGPITLAVALWNHGGQMLQRMEQTHTPYPQFKEKEVAHLARYIRSRNGGPPPDENALPGDPARGRQLFTAKSCASCHLSANGKTAGAPDLSESHTPVTLSNLVGDLWNHYPKMRQKMAAANVGYPPMTVTEMEDLMAYLYWLRAFGAAGDPAAGRTLYESKKCASCHADQQRAGKAPALVGSETTRSPYAMLAAIWSHGPRMEKLLRERNMDWPELNGAEMRNLIAFFRSGS